MTISPSATTLRGDYRGPIAMLHLVPSTYRVCRSDFRHARLYPLVPTLDISRRFDHCPPCQVAADRV
jgi:hypothetical protein